MHRCSSLMTRACIRLQQDGSFSTPISIIGSFSDRYESSKRGTNALRVVVGAHCLICRAS